MFYMQIKKNDFNRFNIDEIKDPGLDVKGKTVQGITGFHGGIGALFGVLLEKIFHKTVGIKTDDGTYYLNRKSLTNYIKRVDPTHKLENSSITDSKAAETILAKLRVLHGVKNVIRAAPQELSPEEEKSL